MKNNTRFLWMALLAMASVSMAVASEPEEAGEADAQAEDGWQLVFSDAFDREELGEDWQVLSGDWRIEDGTLVGRGQLMVDRSMLGYHRLEFTAESDDPTDLSPVIHSGPSGFSSGYLLQFGGLDNTYNVARRKGKDISTDYKHMIEPGKVHRIVAEFDGEHVRLTVDGQLVHEYKEESPLLGEHHAQAGLYIYKPSRIHQIKLYQKVQGDKPDDE